MAAPAPAPERPRSISRYRTPIALAAVAAVILLVIAVVTVKLVTGGPDSSVDPSALPDPPAAAADPIPTGPIIKKIPADCGLSKATVTALVPKGRPTQQQRCQWAEDGASATSLTVHIEVHSAPSSEFPQRGLIGSRRVETLPGTPIATAMSDFAGGQPARGESNFKHSERVTGLGDEALFKDNFNLAQDEDFAEVRFRIGNTVALVIYESSGEKDQGVPERKIASGALKAAAEIAEGLWKPAPHRPSMAPKDVVDDYEPLDSACHLVPKESIGKVVDDEFGGRPAKAPVNGFHDASQIGCGWQSEDHRLTLSVLAYRAQGPINGPHNASRQYAALHADTRAAPGGEKYFAPISGLGDQAFAAYAKDATPGRVLFRKANFLVEVVYTEADGASPLTRQDQLKGAYAIATQAAVRLPR